MCADEVETYRGDFVQILFFLQWWYTAPELCWNHCHCWRVETQDPRDWFNRWPLLKFWRNIFQCCQKCAGGRGKSGQFKLLGLSFVHWLLRKFGRRQRPSTVVISDTVGTWRWILQVLMCNNCVAKKLYWRARSMSMLSCCRLTFGTHGHSMSTVRPIWEAYFHIEVIQVWVIHGAYLSYFKKNRGVLDPVYNCSWVKLLRMSLPLVSCNLSPLAVWAGRNFDP